VKKPEKAEDVPGPVHPLVRVHPATGRKAPYLGRRRIWPSQFIEGVSHEESETLLNRLWRMRRRRNTPGRTSGASATCWSGTTAAPCTTASR
jgi:alpha-ketoglutarate-dependent taurine dioxygenase